MQTVTVLVGTRNVDRGPAGAPDVSHAIQVLIDRGLQLTRAKMNASQPLDSRLDHQLLDLYIEVE